MVSTFEQGYFKKESLEKLQPKFKFHSFSTSTIPPSDGSFFKWKPFEFEDYIPTSTGTFTSQIEPPVEPSKLTEIKRKRSPKNQFLKDKDIEKLLDKYFNESKRT